MSVEKDITTFLLNKDDISSLVGQRVYPIRLIDGVSLPALTYMRVSSTRERSHDGTYRISPNLQIDCWGNTYAEARELADTVIDTLDNFTGIWTNQISIFNIDDRDISESETGIYHIITEFEVHETR